MNETKLNTPSKFRKKLSIVKRVLDVNNWRAEVYRNSRVSPNHDVYFIINGNGIPIIESSHTDFKHSWIKANMKKEISSLFNITSNDGKLENFVKTLLNEKFGWDLEVKKLARIKVLTNYYDVKCNGERIE